MLISRCAWHPRYFGRRRWQRVVSWRGLRVEFTDGMCARCRERFGDEYREVLERWKERGFGKTA